MALSKAVSQPWRMVRLATVGKTDEAASFEEMIHKIIDCKQTGFESGTQVVNYVTSKYTRGFGNERLYNYLLNHQLSEDSIGSRDATSVVSNK